MARTALTLTFAGAMAVGGCTTTGDPQSDRALAGAAGGALVGQILGGNTEMTVLGTIAGATIGAASAGQAREAHPCAEIYRRYRDPEVAGDHCELHLTRIGR